MSGHDIRNAARCAAGVFTTFVLRLSRRDDGRVDGIVERVQTGEKERIHDLAALPSAIARLLRGHTDDES